MLYDYAKQLIGVCFLIAVVNLLVMPDVHKKIITFYLHFLIIIIILNPLIRIMDNEDGSFLNSISIVNEKTFEESIRNYQETMNDDLKEFTFIEVDSHVREVANKCQTQIVRIELDETLIIQMVETSEAKQNCMIVELGISREDVIFERGGLSGGIDIFG